MIQSIFNLIVINLNERYILNLNEKKVRHTQ